MTKIKVASFEDPKRLSQFPSQWGEHLPHVMGRMLYVVDEDNKSGAIEEFSLTHVALSFLYHQD